MSEKPFRPEKAYKNLRFLSSRDARPLRVLAEYLEPEHRFKKQRVQDTIVFFGSARARSLDDAQNDLDEAKADLLARPGTDQEDGVERARKALRLASYYQQAEELAYRLTRWSKALAGRRRRFIVTSGGGPGIMEAANRGAARAKGLTVGLGISIPSEPSTNAYVSRELAFEFHYFFTRKFWFIYLAKAIVVFPGGFGTFDELFEVLTLCQTRKIVKDLPVVLYGREYWDAVVDINAMRDWGVIGDPDLSAVKVADTVDEAFAHLRDRLTTTHRLGPVEPPDDD